MPKSSKKLSLQKIPHPKSRKVLQLSKQLKRKSSLEKTKMVNYVKQNMVGEKLIWFRDHLEPDVTSCTPECTMKLIELYLSRFDEELEQIRLKHSVGNRKNRQHANREDIIQLTKLQEKEEYHTCGLEIPDLLNPKQLEILRRWEGELRFLQNFKLRRYSQKQLKEQASVTGTGKSDSVGVAENETVSKNVEMSDDTGDSKVLGSVEASDVQETEGSELQNENKSSVNEENEEESNDIQGTKLDFQNENKSCINEEESCPNEKNQLSEDTVMDVDT